MSRHRKRGTVRLESMEKKSLIKQRAALRKSSPRSTHTHCCSDCRSHRRSSICFDNTQSMARSRSRDRGRRRSRSASSSSKSRSSSSRSSSSGSSSRSSRSSRSSSSSSRSSSKGKRAAVRGDAPDSTKKALPPAGRSRSRSPQRSKSRGRSGSPRRRRSRSPTPKSAKVRVNHLTRNVTKDHVQEIFASYGTIKSMDMPVDRNHQNLFKGFAYVEFETSEEAEKAIKYMDGGQIDGQEINVSIVLAQRVRPFPDRNRGGGYGRGNWRGGRSPPRRRRTPPPRYRGRSPRRSRSRSRSARRRARSSSGSSR